MSRIPGAAHPRRLRLAMLTEFTRRNGSSRVVCYQFGPRLEKEGIDVTFFPPSTEWLYVLCHERWTQPRLLALALKAMYWFVLVLPRRLVQIVRCTAYDVVFVQRGLLKHDVPPALELLLWLLVRKICQKPMIYALDDAQYLVSPAWHFHLRFAIADWVFTGNDGIRDYASRFNRHIKVIESVVDEKYYLPRAHEEHQPVRIGWVGTLLDDHGPLPVIERAVLRLQERYPVVLEVISNRPYVPFDSRLCLVNTRWRLADEVSSLRRLDIGVMPLADDDFARAKEGYKLKQYMAAGLPVVCSPVGKNNEIVAEHVTGLFARDEDEWVARLAALVADAQLRGQMGAAGRARVCARYSLAQAAPEMGAWLWDVARPAQECGARKRWA